MKPYLADRRARIIKKHKIPTRSDFQGDDKENLSSDNALRISDESSLSKRNSSTSIVLRLSETDNCSIEDANTSLSNNLVNSRNEVKPINPEISEVIIISDSSDNDEIFSRKPESTRCATNILKTTNTSILISSSTDESDDGEDFILKYNDSKKMPNQRKGGRRISSNFKNLSSFKIRQRCSILYTSDDTASTVSSNKSKSSSSKKSKETATSTLSHISPTPRSVGSDNIIKGQNRIISKSVSKSLHRLENPPRSTGIGASPSFRSTKCQKVFPRKMNRVTQLSKSDALKILKVVKSKRLNYFSASSSDKSQVSDTPDSEEENSKKDEPKKSIIIEETDSENSKYTNSNANQILKAVNAKKYIIKETDSEVENSIVQKSPEILKRHKTAVTKFLETPTIIQEQGYNDLSARKRTEIANWLMNSPDLKNDSSLSHVSESNRNSLSSGNSSLDRLEANYETPNNRDKFLRANAERNRNMNDSDPKTPTSAASNVLNSVTLLDTNKRVNFRTPQPKTPTTPSNFKTTIPTVKKRQTKIDDYLRKTKTLSGKYVTEMTSRNNTNKMPSTVSKPLNPEDVRIEDCVDILDKLYGDTWRAKADAILSEPRKQHVIKTDRGVQTDRKLQPSSKGRLNIESESDEDFEFGKFLQNVRPNLNSTRKARPQELQSTNLPRKTKPQESKRKEIENFINDGSSSDGSVPSSYYTALTNPQLNIAKKKATGTPVSTTTLRAIAICDPETDEEPENKGQNFRSNDLNRRKLIYSDDENDSNTSEYDPEDIIPPKSLPKKNTLKTAQRFMKPSSKFIQIFETKKTPGFLASLSASVPLSCIHPDARMFRENFKKTKEVLCQRLYALYNEKIFDNKLPKDLLIDWSTRMRGTAGFCYNKKSIKTLGRITRGSRIVLSTKVVDKADRLRDTLVHEMCHAASWIINEVSDGHGPIWKGWAKKAMKVFPELPPVSVCHNYKIHTKYTYKCTNCGYSIGRHSKSLDVKLKRCGYCHGKFELFINRTTKSGTVQLKTPTRSKDPSAFALYVKDNYHSVKQNRRSMKHGDVMRVLGQQFSAFKIAKKQNILEEDEKSSF